MQKFGGMQTRIYNYLKKLEEYGCNVYFLTDTNQNAHLQSLSNFTLNYRASNFSECLLELAEQFQITHIEFNIKNNRLVENINFDALEKYKTGLVIHSIVDCSFMPLQRFNYKIVTTGGIRRKNFPYLDDAQVIYNALPKQENIFKYTHQRTALLVTRIDKEKQPTIEAFIEFCQNANINFEIAGSEAKRRGRVIAALKAKYHLEESIFIGDIETIDFLKEYVEKYIFIAGVGQVVIEAGALGYPVFVASHFGLAKSFFLTPEKASLLRRYNFTIQKSFLDCHPYYEDDAQKEVDLNRILLGDVAPFCVHAYMESHCEFESAFEQYVSLLSIERSPDVVH